MIIDKPYKIIWKYKNENRYQQYNIYIFVGNISPEINIILEKMKDLSLFDTLMQLSNDEIKKMEHMYDIEWYKYFFNMHHCLLTITQIQANITMINDLRTKMGLTWYDTHIKDETIIKNKTVYSYTVDMYRKKK